MDVAPQAQIRCVVWHPRGVTLHPELDAALRRPGIREVRCDSPLTAFAHLTTRQTPLASRADETTVLLLVEPTRLADLLRVIEVVDRYNPGAAVWQFDSTSQPRLRAVAAEDVCHWRTAPEAALAPEPKVSTPQPVPQQPVPKAAPALRPPTTGRAPAAPALRLAGEGELPPERSSLPADATPHPYPDVKPPQPPLPVQPAVLPAAATPEPALPAPPKPVAPPEMPTPLLTEEELAMLLTEDADQHR